MESPCVDSHNKHVWKPFSRYYAYANELLKGTCDALDVGHNANFAPSLNALEIDKYEDPYQSKGGSSTVILYKLKTKLLVELWKRNLSYFSTMYRTNVYKTLLL